MDFKSGGEAQERFKSDLTVGKETPGRPVNSVEFVTVLDTEPS